MYNRRLSGEGRNVQDRREEAHHLSEAEAASLRKDADMFPADRTTTDDYLAGETEEEYLRRTRRNKR
jgi:hypothetical protein